MKTLEQIKNEYAVSKDFDNWWHLEIMNIHEDNFSKHVDEVMILAQKECLKLASENFIGASNFAVDTRNAITNENNIIK